MALEVTTARTSGTRAAGALGPAPTHLPTRLASPAASRPSLFGSD